MKISAFLSNLFFMLLNGRNYYSFLEACKKPEKEQSNILLKIVRKNLHSSFGKTHSFGNSMSIKDFQKNVPITNYDGYFPEISKIRNGENNVLCSERVKCLALTSGSSAASKFIPYTDSLKDQFRRSINPWICDLLLNYPKLKYGTQFWIITPASKNIDLPESNIPFGFENDSDYFGRIEKYFITTILTLPDELNKITDSSNYFYLLSYFLLKDEEIRLISIWNPSLIISVFKFMKDNFLQLSRDIASGRIQLPNNTNSRDREFADNFCSQNRKRGEFLVNLNEFIPSNIKFIWPKLELISCWTDAWARVFVEDMKNLLPGIPIQSKGLMATEGVVSIPLKRLKYPILSIKSHFYEFLNLADNQIYLAHELKQGEKYEIIITTGGGLYRYPLNNIVEVMGYYLSTPLIKFISQIDIISDICGEKLNEYFIREIIDNYLEKYLTGRGLIFLAPQQNNESTYYTIYIEKGIVKSNVHIPSLLKGLDKELMHNFHYNHCRNMHQLDSPKLKILTRKGISQFLSQRKEGRISSTSKSNYLVTSIIDPDCFDGIIYTI